VIASLTLAQQEARFADAFACHDLELVRPLYADDIVSVFCDPSGRLEQLPCRR
jgi:hypothetical protein